MLAQNLACHHESLPRTWGEAQEKRQQRTFLSTRNVPNGPAGSSGAVPIFIRPTRGWIFTDNCEKHQVLERAVEYILRSDKFIPEMHLHIR